MRQSYTASTFSLSSAPRPCQILADSRGVVRVRDYSHEPPGYPTKRTSVASAAFLTGQRDIEWLNSRKNDSRGKKATIKPLQSSTIILENSRRMPRNSGSSAFMKPFVVLALPGMYLFYKYSQYKRQQQEQNRRRVTERELAHLNHKIDKLLSKLEENEPELATSQEDECVICVNAKATMQTSPCGHRVVCRKCFVKTIQMAVSQRLLPLRCVICRAKILRLKQSGNAALPNSSSSWSMPPSSTHHHHHHHNSSSTSSSSNNNHKSSWMVSSASHYSMGPVPISESLYSMASGSSSISGVSSASGSSTGSGCSAKYGANRNYPRQPTGSLRKSQTHSMKYHLQEYKEPVRSNTGPGRDGNDKGPRLPPIQEFQREFRLGKERSASTRIRCAQKIVTQLETTPVITSSNNNSSKQTTNNTTFFRGKTAEQERTKNQTTKLNKLLIKDDKRRSTDSDKKDNNNLKQVIKNNSNNSDDITVCNNKVDEINNKEQKKLEKGKSDKKEKNKEKELTKAEKKEQKKEAKAEKKNAKKEAKNEKKDKKE